MLRKCKDELHGQHPQNDENFVDMMLESVFPSWLKSSVSYVYIWYTHKHILYYI